MEVFSDGYATAHNPDAASGKPYKPYKPTAKPTGQTTPPASPGPVRARLRPIQLADDIEQIADAWLDATGHSKPPKGWAAFVDELLARRMGREGRFFRVHYSTGAVMDVVPDGSLACGMAKLTGGQWRHQTPDIGRLWTEHLEANGKPTPTGKPKAAPKPKGTGKGTSKPRAAKPKGTGKLGRKPKPKPK